MSSGPHEDVSLELESIDHGLRFAGHSGSFNLVIDSGPGAVAPNPVRLLMLSLGACVGMDVISILRKKRQKVTGYEVRVEARPKDRTTQRIYGGKSAPHRDRGGCFGRSAATPAVVSQCWECTSAC